MFSLFCHLVVPNSFRHGLLLARPFCLQNSPGKNTRVGCHFLLQGIFPTHGLNSGLLHCRETLYPLSHQASPTCCAAQPKKKNFFFKAQQRVLNELKIHLMNEVLSEYQLCSERNVNLGVSYSTRLATVIGKLLTTQTFVLLLKS